LHIALVASNDKTLAKVDAVVERIDKVSSGTLMDITTTAQQTIEQTRTAAQREINKHNATSGE
jgi:hypothetical protein